MGDFSQFRPRAGEDFQPEVLLIPETVGSPLDGPDLFVDALYEAQGHLVRLVVVGLDAVPMDGHYQGETLERLQPLPS